MRLAVNYSPQSSRLLSEGKIKLDLFKCPDWPDLVKTALTEHATYVHFSLATLSHNLEETNWQVISDLLELTGTKNVNLHLLSEPTLDPHNPEQVQKALQEIIGLVNMVIDRFGSERIVIENTPMTITGRDYLRPFVDAQIISEIIEKTGCRFLLDISHAFISAVTLGIDVKSYIYNLPTKQLAELHITGMDLENGQLIDHRAMRAEDWPVLVWALEQIHSGSWATPDIVAFEYSGFGKIMQAYSDPFILESQVPILYKMVHPD